MKLPSSRKEIQNLQRERKRAAVERAAHSPFWKKRLPKIDLGKRDDREVWRKIPILDKDTLRAMTDTQFYSEFCHTQHDGVAEPEAIDTIAKLGFNHPIGPLALADLIGLETCVAIMEVLHAGLGDDKYAPCPLLQEHVAAGRLGRKSGHGFYDYS